MSIPLYERAAALVMRTKTHPRERLEMIVDHPHLSRFVQTLEAANVAVVDQVTLDAILEDLAALFRELPGVAFISDVEVIRPERF